MIKADTQLLYSSDYPHWDMDLPSTIYDLPFLNEQGKRNILGGNAQRAVRLRSGVFAGEARAPRRAGGRAGQRRASVFRLRRPCKRDDFATLSAVIAGLA